MKPALMDAAFRFFSYMLANEIILTIMAVAWIPLSVLVGRVAKSYDRSAIGWFVLAMVFSPLAAYVFLVVADVPYKAVQRQEREARVRARQPGQHDVTEAARHEMDCPRCGAAINPSTRDGLYSPEAEPWRLLCNNCDSEITP